MCMYTHSICISIYACAHDWPTQRDHSFFSLQDEESTKKGEGVRQGRFVLMTDRLFDMADRAPHDHCCLKHGPHRAEIGRWTGRGDDQNGWSSVPFLYWALLGYGPRCTLESLSLTTTT